MRLQDLARYHCWDSAFRVGGRGRNPTEYLVEKLGIQGWRMAVGTRSWRRMLTKKDAEREAGKQ